MSSHTKSGAKRPISIRQLIDWKKKGRRIVAVTAYDYTMARLVEQKLKDALGAVEARPAQDEEIRAALGAGAVIFAQQAIRLNRAVDAFQL